MKLPDNFYFSQSNLQDYVDCHYRFYLQHILHLKWPALVADDAMAFEMRGQTGARFHQMVQQFLTGVPEDLIDAVAENDPSPEISRWWQDFLAHIYPKLEGRKFIETTLSTSLAGTHLLAKYDLIVLENHGNLTIYDWKTTHNKPSENWLLKRIQTRLYRLILSRASRELIGDKSLHPGQITMQYWFANHPQAAVSLPYSQKAYETDQEYFQELLTEIAVREEGSFSRTTAPEKCRFCVYRSHCDRGVEAGDFAAFEEFDFEPESLDSDIEFEELTEIKF